MRIEKMRIETPEEKCTRFGKNGKTMWKISEVFPKLRYLREARKQSA